jgi:hypothetical protein
MPTPRKPTSLHIAAGSFKKDPQRAKAREHEPVVTDPIGPPPTCFIAVGTDLGYREKNELAALWEELIVTAAPGVLNRSHRWHMETACRLMYKHRHGTAKTGDTTNLNKCLTQMGMNPAAQSTVSGIAGIAPAGGTSRLAALAQKARAS